MKYWFVSRVNPVHMKAFSTCGAQQGCTLVKYFCGCVLARRAACGTKAPPLKRTCRTPPAHKPPAHSKPGGSFGGHCAHAYVLMQCPLGFCQQLTHVMHVFLLEAKGSNCTGEVGVAARAGQGSRCLL